MGTSLKFGLILVIWTAFFFLSFQVMYSQDEEEILKIQNALNYSMAWRSYSLEQTLEADKKEQSRIKAVYHEDPYVMWVNVKTKLTDTEDFVFEVFFQPDLIYLHNMNTDAWNKVDYTHPVSGELESVRDPFSFWQRRLKDIDKIISKDNNGSFITYVLQLNPFRDEAHGMRFEKIKSADMEIRLKKQPLELDQMKLTMNFEQEIFRRYDEIVYFMRFSDINQARQIILPKESEKAVRID
ncbi:hypothetical protein [Microaerobacter geothermalis]|uniref:hypothetical protein n=1 Tax=Microaerobacter geothermalis TaxID=674972 RepID=UPI001F4121A2|nr:hypothetical protein [Microaerobacter geothermalis]